MMSVSNSSKTGGTEMDRNSLIAVAALLGGMLFSASAGAQTMYRCGNKYQDRPCDAGQQGKAIGSTGTSSQAASGSTDAECAQRRTDAQKMMWAREAGTTAEVMLAELETQRISASQKAQQRKLVLAVYQKRGTAPEVAAAIAADCMAEKERAAQAAALAAEIMKAQGQGQVQPAAPAGTQSQASGASQGQDAAAAQAAQKKAQCDSLNAQLESNSSNARAGGSPATMDRYNREREVIHGKRRDAGC
jgi:hypothetical protein